VDEAFEALLSSNELELKYIIAQSDEMNDLKYSDAAQEGSQVKLVYAPDFNKPLCIDAFKGIAINYHNRQPYKEQGALLYNDISGHRSEEKIMLLSEIGLLPAEESFRPDDPITQKEFPYIVSKLKGSYYTDGSSTDPFSQKELDAMYRTLINEGIVDEDERNPDMKVTREEAVMYLLRAVGYRSFAELEGVFACDFADRDDIDPDLIGYVAIAKSLKIVTGSNGRFMPQDEITRADAVALVYNYLRR
jgi:hypothetical protein